MMSRSDASMFAIVILTMVGALLDLGLITLSTYLQRLSVQASTNAEIWRDLDRQVDFIVDWSNHRISGSNGLLRAQERLRDLMEHEAESTAVLDEMVERLDYFPYTLLVSHEDYMALKAAKVEPSLRTRLIEVANAPESVVQNQFMHWDLATQMMVRSGRIPDVLRARSEVLVKIRNETISRPVILLGGVSAAVLAGIVLFWIRLLRPSLRERRNALAELETLFDNLPGFVVGIDKKMRLVSANRAYRIARGLEVRGAIPNIPMQMIWNEREARVLTPHVRKALSGRRSNVDTLFDVSGEPRHVNASYVPVRNRDGSIEHVTGLIVDVHERVTAERALRDSEENLRITLDAIGEGVIATNVDGAIVRMNRVACALTGWTLREAKGMSIGDIFPIIDGTTREPIENPLEIVHRTTAAASVEKGTILLSRDGSEHIISVTGAPIFSGDGGYAGAVLSFRDVTTEHYMTQQLTQNEKMRALGQLAGGIAHDFNNVLAGILGASELIAIDRTSTLGERSQRAVKQIADSAMRAAGLTEKLISFSRATPLDLKVIDLETIVENSVGMFSTTIDKRYTVTVTGGLDNPYVMGSESRIGAAILNILINAMQSMKDGGEINVHLENRELDMRFCSLSRFEIDPGKYATIAITDGGSGIAPSHLARIFEPFFTTRPVGEGSGLGLAEAYGAVVDHKGAFTVESTLGEGTTFVLMLPSTDERETGVETTAPEAGPTQRPLSILLVDDEEAIRMFGASALENIGHSATLASSGSEAIDIFARRREEIDVVIMDLNMPGMTGLEALKRMVAIDEGVKVVIATGFNNNLEVPESLAKNVIALLRKPYRLARLQALLAEKF